MKIYIAGPMTGLPDYNRAAFYLAADNLKEQGHIPKHTAWMVDGLDRADYMRNSIELMLTCDAIFLLNGWKDSLGSKVEKSIADVCGLQIIEEVTEDDR
jgi:hypothetical protein